MAEPNHKRPLWPALVLGVSLALMSVLLYARVRETGIELDLAVSEVGFSLAGQQVLTRAANLSLLGVSGVQEPATRLSAGSSGKRQGVVTLAPVVLPAGSRVRVETTNIPRQYRVSIRSSPLELRADMFGPVSIQVTGEPERHTDLGIPKAVSFRGGPDDVDLDLTFPSVPQEVIAPQLQVNALSFSHVEQIIDADKTVVRRLSSLLSGTLYFESLNDQERRLRPGEELDFQQVRGEIRVLRFGEGSIGVRFHGQVRGMTTGSEEGKRSLMPNYLEWLHARHGLALLWGAALYLAGIVAAALRWWGVRA